MRTTRFLETLLLHWFCRTSGTAGTSWRRTCRIHWSREDFGRIRKTRVLARHESRKLHPKYCAVLREGAKTVVSSAENSGRVPVQQYPRDRWTDWNDTSQKMETTAFLHTLHTFVYLYIISLAEFYRYQSDFAKKYIIENINVLSEGKKATLLRTGGGLLSLFRQPSEEELIRSLVWCPAIYMCAYAKFIRVLFLFWWILVVQNRWGDIKAEIEKLKSSKSWFTDGS